jgi:ABC-type phosphate/phosphonate transport system substrate-binding protein
MPNRQGHANIAALLILLTIVPVAGGRGQNDPTGGTVVQFGLSTTVVEADVNLDDVLAAIKVWAVKMGAGTGSWTQSDARIFRDLPSLIAAVNNGDSDIVALSTQEYLTAAGSLRAEPALAYLQSGQVELEYVVLARQGGEIKAPADLRGRRISIARGGRNSMVPLWLDALLLDNGLPSKESFFKEIKEVSKTSQVVLPVFFGQMDAGVVIKSAFETAAALNPQIGQQLKVIATSPRLAPMVTCFRGTLPAEQKAQLMEKALKLHETQGGLQAFTVFKLERLVQWDLRYFDAVKDLMRKQKLARSRGTADSK